ncbi:MAG TPA: molecular chaperone DnaJ, partial [Caulobacteraceae bacterium]|nr:molecular chaperone DnaJ [Caulobacteraceae bacterium]
MIFVALAVLMLAALVGLGRKPLMARARGRYAAFGMAAVAIAAGAWDAVRGGWLGGSMLATAALWLVTSASRPLAGQPHGMGLAEAASMLGVAE